MNIMIFADQESKLLYEYYDPERMKDIDLIISCGDLPPEYLTFFATLCHAPLLYVKGNHDGKYEQNVAFRAKCKMFSRHLQKPILKTEKGRFKGL